MKAVKTILKKIVIIILALCAAVAVSFINHRIQLGREKELLKPLGVTVEVDGADMSVYSEGEGDKTLVFMSGFGTCSPILDFRSLYSRLSDDYKTVVVEKFGYGFSDVTDKPRDLDAILENDREALKKAGIEAPYILCPHSMSGIEALYWAQKYPDEAAAIIGLDMALPSYYEQMKISAFSLRAVGFTARAGLTRIGNFSESDAILHGTLTEEEKAIYRAVFFSRTMTEDMINEITHIKEGASRVSGDVSVPMLMFCSDGSGGTGFTKEEWQKQQSDFAEKNGAEIIYLDCGHYVHDYEYVKIAEDIKAFLQ